MRRRLALLAAVLAVTGGTPASAYQTAPNGGGNADYHSLVRAVTPPTPGLSARVLGHDNLVQLENHSGRTIVVYGYTGDQYARLLADGTVQLNLRSPAFYLNEYRFGDQTVPAYADARAAPEWRTMDRSATLVWHDHRIHAAKAGGPPAGTQPGALLRAYRIPLRIGSAPGAVAGDLYWVGGHSHTSWMLFALPLLVLVVALMIVDSARRARRSRAAV
jgi:hypothetical protein